MARPATHKRFGWLAACALWIGAWQVASLLVGSDLVLAGPWQTCVHLLSILTNPRTISIVWFSLSRIAAGFLLAFSLGVALGLAAHRWDAVRTLAAPFVAICRSVPVACVVVLLLIWVGSGAVSGLAVFLMAFPALYLAVLEGLDQSGDAVHEMLVSFCVSRPRRFCAHVWQRVLPYASAASKNACGMAWKAGVAAELIGTPRGSMGERVYQAKILFETADLFAWTVLIVVCSFLCERLFVWLLTQSGPVLRRMALMGGRTRRGKANEAHASARENAVPAHIVLEDVSIGYDRERPVTTHLDLKLNAGARTVLADASGQGKTTLLRTIAGIIPPLSGTAELPNALSVVFQDTRLVEELDAADNVRIASVDAIARKEAITLLEELLPKDALLRPVRELSGGQRRRVEIVRALAHPSAAVLLDEPFASLDEESHECAATFVCRHLAGRTLVVASHAPEDADLLDATSRTIPQMSKGDARDRDVPPTDG